MKEKVRAVLISLEIGQDTADQTLFTAARNGDVAQALAAIAQGADVNALSPLGPLGAYTPLTLAARKGHTAMVEVLLNHGADPSAETPNEPGVSTDTVLSIAVGNGYVEIVRLLLRHGARVNASNSGCRTALMSAQLAAHRPEKKAEMREIIALLEEADRQSVFAGLPIDKRTFEAADDSGILALIDADGYHSFVDDDWDLNQLMIHLQDQMQKHRLLMWMVKVRTYWRVQFRFEPSEVHGFREVIGSLTLTKGRLLLTNLESLAVAAQSPELSLPMPLEDYHLIQLLPGIYTCRLIEMHNHAEHPEYDREIGMAEAHYIVEILRTDTVAAPWQDIAFTLVRQPSGLDGWQSEEGEMKEKVRAVLISLEIGKEMALFILLGSDGTINRMGTGAKDNFEKAMFVGRSGDGLFAKFMALVDEGMLRHGGKYTLPNPQGQLCTLKLLFQIPKSWRGQDSIGFEFVYGADSEGPPAQVSDLVIAAVEMTQPWYEEQKAIAGK